MWALQVSIPKQDLKKWVLNSNNVNDAAPGARPLAVAREAAELAGVAMSTTEKAVWLPDKRWHDDYPELGTDPIPIAPYISDEQF